MTVLYCTQDDVTNRLSLDGVAYREDDSPPGLLGDILNDASAMVDEYVFFMYDPAQMATSDWVRHRTADIASYLMCERRGNPVPPGIAHKYERSIEKLAKVRSGQIAIPGLPVRKTMAPVLSNVRIRLDPFPRTVVERNRSTGKPAGYSRHDDRLDFLDYSI